MSVTKLSELIEDELTAVKKSSMRIRPVGYQFPVGLDLTEAVSAQGGTQSIDGSNTVCSFDHPDGNNTNFIPDFDGTVEVLVLAGGGGGGGRNNNGGGGGGGAGGLLYNNSQDVQKGTQYVVTVGTGGQGEYSQWPATSKSPGKPSQFRHPDSTTVNILATGGGHGGSQGYYAGAPGGSGGGGGGGGGNPNSDPTWFGGNGIPGQGNNGGTGSGPFAPSGGGGGAGGVGANGFGVSTGGDGLEYSISGSPLYYAGGGAGYRNTEAAGGSGVGGNGSYNGSSNPGQDAVANRGSGGGGGRANPFTTARLGGNGSNGMVIVRFATLQGYTIN